MTTIHNLDRNDILWTVLCDKEISKRRNFAYAMHYNRYVVIAGGIQGNGRKVRSAAIYDVSNPSYTTLPYLPFGGGYRGVI